MAGPSGKACLRPLLTRVRRQVQQDVAAAELSGREAGQRRGDRAGKEGSLDLGRP